MSNVIKFPKASRPPHESTEAAEAVAAPKIKGRWRLLWGGLVRFIWVVTVLVWPVLKWVLSISTFFQLIRMIYHWNTPGVHAGWSFLAYFAALTAITYFVSVYKPKGL